MAIQPLDRPAQTRTHGLFPLTPALATVVAQWAGTNGEAFWLAPRTTPPLTGEKILSWSAPGRQQLLLCPLNIGAPVAYGELNVLNIDTAEYWIGHLIVDPPRRGAGLGTLLAQLLVQRAFITLAARRVTLVVFPENKAAIRSYEKVGFQREGHETHYFPIYMRRARLLRMAIQA